ncbi:UNVERIFIED_CONTAM: Retrovirus-related Pol polyprotein from transposon gypsy [Sesamum indicum]
MPIITLMKGVPVLSPLEPRLFCRTGWSNLDPSLYAHLKTQATRVVRSWTEREQAYRPPHDTSEGGGNRMKSDKPREPKYQPKYHNYTPLNMSREKAVLMVENADVLKWPRHTRFHRERGHKLRSAFCRKMRLKGSSREKEFVLKVEEEEAISFDSSDRPVDSGTMNNPMVIKLDIANFTVHKTPLVGFGGSEVASLGMIELPVSMGEEPKRKTLMVRFLVVDTPFSYNVILSKPGLNLFRAVISMYHMKMKFPTDNGIGEVACDQKEARKCYNLSLKGESSQKKRKVGEDAEPWPYQAEHMKPSHEYKAVNVDLFAWSPADFNGINLEVIVHRLNVDPMVRPVQQKRRSFGVERNRIIEQEVAKLLKAGDLNKTYPKDPYPLPRIDVMVNSTAGFEMFSMMDAYQGYHQIYMAKEDHEKTSFIT